MPHPDPWENHLRSVPLRSWQPPLGPRLSLVPPKSICLSPPTSCLEGMRTPQPKESLKMLLVLHSPSSLTVPISS